MCAPVQRTRPSLSQSETTSARAEARLAWLGRAWEPRANLTDGEDAAPCTTWEEGSSDVRILHGDALSVASALLAEGTRADLVYVDPPYASQADYTFEARLDGPADGRTRRSRAYGDRWHGKDGGVGAYLEMMAPRLEAMAALLRPTATMWVHLDWRASYLVRVVMEEILGRDAFLNEIVWKRAPNLGRQAQSAQFGRTLDSILVFGGPKAVIHPPTRLERIDDKAVRFDEQKRPFTTAPRGDYTDASIARLDAEGRVHRTPSGRVYIKYFLRAEGDAFFRERRVDTLWTDVAPLRHAAKAERTGYPTQKPLSLLERIVRCATPEGGTVIDLFGGSGTTAEAALRCGRKAILGDAGPVAIATSRARLLRGGFEPRIERVGSAAMPTTSGGLNVTRSARGVTVELTAPKTPLAWAVDVSDGSAFRRAWHAERSVGAGPASIVTTAELPGQPRNVRVRAFDDDGNVAELEARP